MNKLIVLLFALLLTGCANDNLIDVNMEIPENNWMYAKSAKATFEIKDPALAYNIYFKIRNTAAYRYSNIYLIMRLKGDKLARSERFQFKLAGADGKWSGKGSGDLYSSNFLLLGGYRFPKAGKYELEVEQNMRDNPLTGISDVGITVEKAKKK